ncbi:MAG: XdhC family protein [Pseudomonadota bacterium]
MNLSQSTLDLIETLRGSGESFCVATIVRTKDATSAKPGAKAVVTSDGELHGFLGGSCVTGAVRKQALKALDTQEPELIRIKPKDQVVAPVDADGTKLHTSSCPSGGTVEVFLEPMKATRRLVILGASPIARTLVTLARAIGYQTIAGAPGEDNAQMQDADSCFDNFAEAASQAGHGDALILSTQGRRDREALRAALASNAGYIGMVASRRKFKVLADELETEPLLKDRLADVHAPAGLDIKAVEPEEIALSIIGQIVALRRAGQIDGDLDNPTVKTADA